MIEINIPVRWKTRSLVSFLVVGLVVMVQAMLPSISPGVEAASDDSTLHIHKLEQPDSLGLPANGLPMDTSGMAPVPGAEFMAKRVPGIDPTTAEGKATASSLSLAEAGRKVEAEPVRARAVTDARGNATLSGLKPGLYYVQESGVPGGYVSAAPFLVPLPFPDSSGQGTWLDEVHVYPKNASVSIELHVNDEDAVSIGDTVSWQSSSGIGIRQDIDVYRIELRISPGLELAATPTVRIANPVARMSLASSFEEGTHYVIEMSSNARNVTVEFLPAGLLQLESAVSAAPGAQVYIDFETKVLAEGTHTNTVLLYPDQQAIDSSRGIRATADTRWGPLAVQVREQNSPRNRISGARFQLFLSPEDALSRSNPISVSGVDEWTTDSSGNIVIRGLRFSERVNGLDRESTDSLYRVYWAAPTYLPKKWSWVNADPQGGTIKSVENYQTLLFEVFSDDSAIVPWIPGVPINEPAEQTLLPGTDSEEDKADQQQVTENRLASTGVQIGGVVLLGLALLAAGALLLLRRRNSGDGEQS